MGQHVLLGVVSPPLFLLGLSPRMAAAIRSVPLAGWLVAPVPAQVVAALVMIVWHLPPLYDATLTHLPLHIFEHFTFIGAGLLFWWPVIGVTSATEPRPLNEGFKLLYLLIGTIPQDAVALVLQFSRVEFYDFYNHTQRLFAGITPVIDQSIAGAVLMVVGKSSSVIAAIAIFLRWARRELGQDSVLELGEGGQPS